VKRVLLVVAAVVALLVLYPAWLALQIWEQSRDDEIHRAEAIVVLGAAQYNGKPSPVFQARLDHAAYLYEERLADLIIVTGGKQPGDAFTEAEAGQTYLIESDIPGGNIMTEQKGRTTLESLRGVRDIAEHVGFDSLLLVSDPLHSERVKRMAHDLGFEEAYVSWASYARLGRSRETKFRELVREVGALLVYEVLGR
jgi:vancomycin permeability regulator SanA